jgi:hypothetical protein
MQAAMAWMARLPSERGRNSQDRQPICREEIRLGSMQTGEHLRRVMGGRLLRRTYG